MKSNSKNNGWILCPSKRFPGKFYYFNTINGETAWYNEAEIQPYPTIERTYPQMVSPPHELPIFREPSTEPNKLNYPQISLNNYTGKIPRLDTPVFGQATFPQTLPNINATWPSKESFFPDNELTNRDILVQTTDITLGQRFKPKPVVTFKNEWTNDLFRVTQKLSTDQKATQKHFGLSNEGTQKKFVPFSFEQTSPNVGGLSSEYATPKKHGLFSVDQATTPKKFEPYCLQRTITNNSPFCTDDSSIQKKCATSSSDQSVTQFSLEPNPNRNLPVHDEAYIEIGFSKLNLDKDLNAKPVIAKPIFNFTAKKQNLEPKPNIFLECLENNSNTNPVLKINENPFKIPKITKEDSTKPSNTLSISKSIKNKFATTDPKGASQLLIERGKFDLVPIANTKLNKNSDAIENVLTEETGEGEAKETKENSEENKREEQKIEDGDLRMLLIAKRRKSVDTTKTEFTGKKIKTRKVDPPLATQKKKVTFNLSAEVYSYSKSPLLSDSSTQNGDFYFYDEDDEMCEEETVPKEPQIEHELENNQYWYIIVDTEVLLKHYDCLDCFLKTDPQCRLIIPYMVMSEVTSISRGESESKNMITLARYRVRSLNIPRDNVIVQSIGNDKNSVEDDIIRCCLDTIKANVELMLITDNVQLKQNADIFKIKTSTVQEFKNNSNNMKKTELNFERDSKIYSPIYENDPKPTFSYDNRNANLINSTENSINDSIILERIANEIESDHNQNNDAHKMASTPNNTRNNLKNLSSYFNDVSVIQADVENYFTPIKESETASLHLQKAIPEFVNKLKRKASSVFVHDDSFEPTTEKTTTENRGYENANGIKTTDHEFQKQDFASKSIFDDYAIYESYDITIEECLKRFKEKTKMLEDTIECRQEEFLCNFSQIMVEYLSNILSRQKHTKPWTLHEALKYVASLHNSNTFIKTTASTLSEKLFEKNRIIEKIKTNMKADDVVEVIRLGMHLIKYFQTGNYSPSHTMAFREAEASIKDLIRKIQDPTSDLDLSLKTTCTNHSNSTEPKNKRNFVKEKSEILEYLKRHFPEWANSETIGQPLEKDCIQNINNSKIVRTSGKNLSLLKIDKTNTMRMKSVKIDTNMNDIGHVNDGTDNKNDQSFTNNYKNKNESNIKTEHEISNQLSNRNEKYKSLKVVLNNTIKLNENDDEKSPSNTFEDLATSSQLAPKIVRLLPTKTLEELIKKDTKTAKNTNGNAPFLGSNPLPFENKAKKETSESISMSCDDSSLTMVIDVDYYKSNLNDKNCSNDRNDVSKSVENGSLGTNNGCYSMSRESCVTKNIHENTNCNGHNALCYGKNVKDPGNDGKFGSRCGKNYKDPGNDGKIGSRCGKNDKDPGNDGKIGSRCGKNERNDGKDDKCESKAFSERPLKNESPDDSGFGNDSLQAYSMIRTFLFQIHETFMSVKDFIMQSKNVYNNGKIKYSEKMKIHKKVEETYNQIGDIINKLKDILERETSENGSLKRIITNFGSQNSGDNFAENYRVIVKQYLDVGLRLENALGKILVAIEK